MDKLRERIDRIDKELKDLMERIITLERISMQPKE
jgi:hypothetical protein